MSYVGMTPDQIAKHADEGWKIAADLRIEVRNLNQALDRANKATEKLRKHNGALEIAIQDAHRDTDAAKAEAAATLLQKQALQDECDCLTILAECMWQSKTLFEAHRHFVAWRDKTGDLAVKLKAGCGCGDPVSAHGLIGCPNYSEKREGHPEKGQGWSAS